MTDYTVVANGEAEATSPTLEMDVISSLSTVALDHKLRCLREISNQHSQALTQKLANSQSGQNLLHIGSSLSTLPPDLHSARIVLPNPTSFCRIAKFVFSVASAALKSG